MYSDVMSKQTSQSEKRFQAHTISSLTPSSKRILSKKSDGKIHGYQYTIAPKPSTLRPIHSWVITIDEWICDEVAHIDVKDILHLEIYNNEDVADYLPITKDIVIANKRIANPKEKGFNALMAAMVVIAKINAGRTPDISKILSLYNLVD